MPSIDYHLGDALTDSQETAIGRLEFPDFLADTPVDSTAWQRRVYLYVGKHQRLTGEVKKLPNPMALIRRKIDPETPSQLGSPSQSEEEALEIVEIVQWKIIFSQRPEPVGS
ncbi:MAG: hypothetical protein M1838_005066 [Thelocarpon superellum]|nr:MAG: hypothetical protein M1838_005066 [Thelocarpon superellum]